MLQKVKMMPFVDDKVRDLQSKSEKLRVIMVQVSLQFLEVGQLQVSVTSAPVNATVSSTEARG